MVAVASKQKISALVLTHNEQEVIEACLQQLDFVDEIVVLDQSSQDLTAQISKKYTERFYETDEVDFDKNRNRLKKLAKYEWLLYVDADERFSQDTKKEIKEKISEAEFSAYYFPRKNIVLGKWLSHGGWWPDYVPRLFISTQLEKWYGRVHESPKVKGDFGYFKNPIIHLSARNMDLMFKKTIKWAKVEAELSYEANHSKVTIPKVLVAYTREFLDRYFAKLGFLDGLVGIIQAIFQAYHKAIVLVYLWELQHGEKK